MPQLNGLTLSSRTGLHIAAVTLLFQFGCIDPIAESHIEGNVPKGKAFEEYLRRDLTSYFCTTKDCRVEYEFPRNGPTQTGIAYPKYYLWVRCFSGGKLSTEGAVRMAAVDQSAFDVRQFLSAKEIIASHDKAAGVFPSDLLDNWQKGAPRVIRLPVGCR